MDLSTALYRRSLLSIDNVDLPSSQFICFAFMLGCFLLDLMCLVAQGECNMCGFALIYFNSPFLHLIIHLIDGGLEFH
jgi:hypothetical protein